MAIKNYQPTSAGMRFRTGLTFDEVTKKVPDKSLRESLKHSGGRNNTGRITADHRGGGHKRLYRLIDFKRAIRKRFRLKSRPSSMILIVPRGSRCFVMPMGSDVTF